MPILKFIKGMSIISNSNVTNVRNHLLIEHKYDFTRGRFMETNSDEVSTKISNERNKVCIEVRV